MSQMIRVRTTIRDADELERLCRSMKLRYQRGANLRYRGWGDQNRMVARGLLIPRGQISRWGDVVFDEDSGAFVLDDADVAGVTNALPGQSGPPIRSEAINRLLSKQAESKVRAYITGLGARYRFEPASEGLGGRFIYEAATDDEQTGAIAVTIDRDGATTATATGVQGAACAGLLAPLRTLLGPVVHEEWTADVGAEQRAARTVGYAADDEREPEWRP